MYIYILYILYIYNIKMGAVDLNTNKSNSNEENTIKKKTDAAITIEDNTVEDNTVEYNKNNLINIQTDQTDQTDQPIQHIQFNNTMRYIKPIQPDQPMLPLTIMQPRFQQNVDLRSNSNLNSNLNSKQNLQRKSTEQISNKSFHCCECYYKKTRDSRCCGLCFYCGKYIYCNKEHKCCYKCCTPDLKDVWCFRNPSEYFDSGCFLTASGPGTETDCLCTIIVGFCLCKFPLTFPFLLCSVCNGTINYICGTDKNYLF